MIIVLGESVLQLVRATSETPWSGRMWIAVAAAFGIIVGIWRQTFAYGFSAAPEAAPVETRLASTMALHLVTTGSLVVLAAALGVIVRHAEATVAHPWGWVAGVSLACYVACSVLFTVRGRPTHWAGPARAWILGWGVPCVAAVLVVGAFAFALPGWATALLLLAPVTWLVLHDRLRRSRTVDTAPVEGQV